MSNLSFFTPVEFQNSPTFIPPFVLEKVDDYFYLGGEKAIVIPGRVNQRNEKVILLQKDTTLLNKIFKIFSYCTFILPLSIFLVKLALRSNYTFKVVDLRDDLEETIHITDHTIAKIQQLIIPITLGEEHDEIEWLRRGNNLVFKIKGQANLVFKMASSSQLVFHNGKYRDSQNSIDQRFEKMIFAKEICLTHDLDQLVIPHAKKLEIEVENVIYSLIAEECLNFKPDESLHEEHYLIHSDDLNRAIDQLAIFILKTGFNDVTWRNIPVIEEVVDFIGDRRIALIDLEHMGSVRNGFLGDYNDSCGLVGCIAEKQMDRVLTLAKDHGVIFSNTEATYAKNKRLNQLKNDALLHAFHDRKGILNGTELLHVDLDTLDLDLREEMEIQVFVGFEGRQLKFTQKTITLKNVIEEVLEAINHHIQNGPKQASIKRKRHFFFPVLDGPFSKYDNLKVNKSTYLNGGEVEKKSWLDRIFEALVIKGLIYSVLKMNAEGYSIQA